jgi:hypothetical protein
MTERPRYSGFFARASATDGETPDHPLLVYDNEHPIYTDECPPGRELQLKIDPSREGRMFAYACPDHHWRFVLYRGPLRKPEDRPPNTSYTPYFGAHATDWESYKCYYEKAVDDKNEFTAVEKFLVSSTLAYRARLEENSGLDPESTRLPDRNLLPLLPESFFQPITLTGSSSLFGKVEEWSCATATHLTGSGDKFDPEFITDLLTPRGSASSATPPASPATASAQVDVPSRKHPQIIYPREMEQSNQAAEGRRSSRDSTAHRDSARPSTTADPETAGRESSRSHHGHGGDHRRPEGHSHRRGRSSSPEHHRRRGTSRQRSRSPARGPTDMDWTPPPQQASASASLGTGVPESTVVTLREAYVHLMDAVRQPAAGPGMPRGNAPAFKEALDLATLASNLVNGLTDLPGTAAGDIKLCINTFVAIFEHAPTMTAYTTAKMATVPALFAKLKAGVPDLTAPTVPRPLNQAVGKLWFDVVMATTSFIKSKSRIDFCAICDLNVQAGSLYLQCLPARDTEEHIMAALHTLCRYATEVQTSKTAAEAYARADAARVEASLDMLHIYANLPKSEEPLRPFAPMQAAAATAATAAPLQVPTPSAVTLTEPRKQLEEPKRPSEPPERRQRSDPGKHEAAPRGRTPPPSSSTQTAAKPVHTRLSLPDINLDVLNKTASKLKGPLRDAVNELAKDPKMPQLHQAVKLVTAQRNVLFSYAGALVEADAQSADYIKYLEGLIPPAIWQNVKPFQRSGYLRLPSAAAVLEYDGVPLPTEDQPAAGLNVREIYLPSSSRYGYGARDNKEFRVALSDKTGTNQPSAAALFSKDSEPQREYRPHRDIPTRPRRPDDQETNRRDDRGPPRDDRGPPRDGRAPPRDDRGPPQDERAPPRDGGHRLAMQTGRQSPPARRRS